MFTCVSADVVYEEPARGSLLPGLMAQLAPGCVDAVVLVPAASGTTAEHAKVTEGRAFSRRREGVSRRDVGLLLVVRGPR